MIRQGLAVGRPVALQFLGTRTALHFPGEIAVEVLQSEGKLIRIEPLGTAAELRAAAV
jgi:hypothetical protein